MGLRLDSAGGGQFKSVVKQIIQAESQPLRAMEDRKAKEGVKLKLLQDFKARFSTLDKAITDISTFRKFRELKDELGDGQEFFSVTLDKDRAQPGIHQIEITSLASQASGMSSGFEDPDSTIFGSGTIQYQDSNGETQELPVTDEEASLKGVSGVINRSTAPFTASVIQDASESSRPWKLLIAPKNTGKKGDFSLPEFYFYEGDEELSLDETKDSKNAEILLDGFPVELPRNDLDDFLPGINLHLKQARPDRPFTLMINEDYKKVGGKVKELTEQLNKVLEFIEKQNAVDEKTDTSVTFSGDTSLQTIEYQIRNAIHQGYPGSSDDESKKVHLTQIGVEFEKGGQIKFNEDRFNKALENDFDSVAEAISGSRGFANHLRSLLGSYTLFPDSMLNVKEKGIKDHVRQIDREIDSKTTSLEKRRQDLVERFARLEKTLGGMQQQQQYLAAALPGAGGGGGNLVSQLLGG